MSDRSQKLARYIRKQKEDAQRSAKHAGESNQQDGAEQPDEESLLNAGFALLKDDLAREFQNLITEVNAEPGCMDTLGSTFTDKDNLVFKLGDEDKGLTIDFNKEERSAEIKGLEPVKFYYFIRVRLDKNKTKWCYAGGEDREKLEAVTNQLDTVVEKALCALFGVEA